MEESTPFLLLGNQHTLRVSVWHRIMAQFIYVSTLNAYMLKYYAVYFIPYCLVEGGSQLLNICVS